MRPMEGSLDESDEGHSPIGFSGAERWMACPGSVALIATVPRQPSSTAADHGTLCHMVAAFWLLHGSAPQGTDPSIENLVRPYVYTVWGCLPKTGVYSKILYLVEARVAAPNIHPDCRGTVDALIYDHTAKILQVHDLKTGKWPVDAERNPQLMGYAVAACAQYKLKPERIDLYIHQVRLSREPKKWSLDSMDLELFEEEVRDAIQKVEAEKAVLNEAYQSGEDQEEGASRLTLNAGEHCHFCDAKPICPAFSVEAKRTGVEMLLPVPVDYPAAKMERAVAFARKFLPWAKALLVMARNHALKGGKVPGSKLVAGKRSRVYNDPKNIADELTTEAELGGLGLPEAAIYSQPKLKTVNQIREALPPAQQKAFDKLWHWAGGSPQLVDESDERAPYKARAEDYFKAIEEDGGEEETEEDEDSETF